MIENKKSQSETIGFIMIIIILAVIIIIFLGFLFLKNREDIYTSSDMSDLLASMMLYTSNCSTTFYPQYKSVQDLIKECYSNAGELCLNGKTVCEELNDTMKRTIENILDINEHSVYQAYKLAISYYTKDSDTPKEEFLKFEKGNFNNCTARYGGSNTIYQSLGYIEISLRVCKRKI